MSPPGGAETREGGGDATQGEDRPPVVGGRVDARVQRTRGGGRLRGHARHAPEPGGEAVRDAAGRRAHGGGRCGAALSLARAVCAAARRDRRGAHPRAQAA
ncbi:MAG: hypothetical protein D6776_12045 [Planctomycetota bacterium]|nr:MAG: hypothetical protein D6776_12045 [Planctomycetota bacterium]